MIPYWATQWLRWDVVAVFGASVIFLIGATWIFPWWRELAGRTLVFIDLLWIISLFPVFLSAIHAINDNSLGFVLYYATSLSLVAPATLWRLWAIRKMQRDGRRGRAARRAAKARQP